MVLPALLAALAPLTQDLDLEPIPPTPYDRVVELDITADSPTIDGLGPGVAYEYDVEFNGTLHVWTKSEMDLAIRVEDIGGSLLARDGSWRTRTPYVELRVDRGSFLTLLVGSERDDSFGAFELYVITAPETEATRAATMVYSSTEQQARDFVRAQEHAAAREVIVLASTEALRTIDQPKSRALSDAIARLGLFALKMRELDAARLLFESAVAGYGRFLPESHYDLVSTRGNLGAALYGLRDFARAEALFRSVVVSLESTLPEDDSSLLVARGNLAASMHDMGDFVGAHAMRESVLAASERTLPKGHPQLLRAQENMANSRQVAGDLVGAHALRMSVVSALEEALHDDHPDLLRARLSLVSSTHETGDLDGARVLAESVVAAYERLFPEQHPDLLGARLSLANCLASMGELAESYKLRQSVLATYEKILPENHPVLQSARTGLADSLHAAGDVAGARLLREAVVTGYEKALAQNHPDLLLAKHQLAVSMRQMGDFLGAQALLETVVAILEVTLPEDHPRLLRSKVVLANCLSASGDTRGAFVVRRSILVSFERDLPEGHPSLLAARMNFAISLHETGDLLGASSQYESVIGAYEAEAFYDRRRLVQAQMNLATLSYEMGKCSEARVLARRVLSALERALPQDHPELLRARDLFLMLLGEGELEALRALLLTQLKGMGARVLGSLTLAPREVRAVVAAEEYNLATALALVGPMDERLKRSAFELAETMRLAAGEGTRSLASGETDPELAPILEEAADVRRALNDLMTGPAREGVGAKEFAAKLIALSLRRDRLERDARQRLALRGVVAEPFDAEALVAALKPGDAAVGFRRIHWYVDEACGRTGSGADHLLAQVLASDGTLTRVDLGLASELEELATVWRSALGAPLLRGISIEEDDDGNTELEAGSRLRARILDPVLGVAGEDVKRLFVCADDLLFLLPLDALPFDAGDRSNAAGGSDSGAERIGDRLRIVNEVSFARLLAPLPPAETAPSLLAFGGVDYDAEGAVPEGLVASSAPIEATERVNGVEPGTDASDAGDPEGGSISRSALPKRFQELLQARYEVEAIAGLFEEAFETRPALITKKKTTKAALFESAPGKRYLHLATHGWFAPESVRSTEDARSEGQGLARMGIEERVTGLAPMTLCGLALAGANGGRDSLGRVPGILTAEELCSLDLSQCELAVLSACETNVGIRRAGQGIHSLQAALYAAGARSSITSLWKVDDAATRRLFELFYANLWEKGMGKGDALWDAKMQMRDQRHPIKDWAGWVLTGDPG